jgi:microcystin-dependent protein
MSTVKVNEVRHLSNSGTANIVLESNSSTNMQATSTLGLTVTGSLTVSGVSTLNGNTIIGNASSDTMLLTSTVTGFNNFSGFTGEIRMYAGNAAGDSPPTGWLYCNGDTVSSTSANGGTHYNLDGKGNDYQPLFNLLKASNDWGNSSSAAWGTNTIKTPDFRSRSPVGVHTGAATTITAGLTSRTLSDAVGAETHALIIAELASHTHVMTNPASATGQSATHAHTHTMPTHVHSTPGSTTGNQSASHTHSWSLAGWTSATAGNMGVGGNDPGAWGTGTTGAQSGSHTHTVPSGTSGATDPGDTNGISTTTVTMGSETHSHTSSAATTGSGTAHTILSPIIAVNYIIKV